MSSQFIKTENGDDVLKLLVTSAISLTRHIVGEVAQDATACDLPVLVARGSQPRLR